MNRSLIVLFFLCGCGVSHAQTDDFRGEKISFLSLDSLEITADIYPSASSDDPYIILFHQANFSRGAYRTIAPKLNDLSYNCIAVDLRSGHKARGVINETSKRAIAANKKIKFPDAVQDAEAAVLYVRDSLKAENIIVWGSSYSASISVFLGSKYSMDIEGVLCFSPGEYFEIDDQPISSFAPNIKCPVFISSGKNERKKWDGIYENVSAQKSFFLPEEGGAHGSKALWEDKKNNEAYWAAVEAFLESLSSKLKE